MEKLDPAIDKVFKDGDYPKDGAEPAIREEPRSEPKAEAKAEPKPEEKQEAKTEAKPEPKIPDGYVPHGALHEERERRKAAQAQYDDLQRKYGETEARLKAMEDRLRLPPPDPQADPVGHISHKLEQINQRQEKIDKETADERAVRQQREQYQQFQNVYGQAAATFTKGNPDFLEAYNFLNSQKTDELKEAGYSEAEINGIIHRQEVEFALKAFKDGVNPAERIYNVARRRGYSKKETQDPQVEPSKKLETISEGQSKSPEFSASGGGKPKLTMDYLANVSDAEFVKLTAGENWEKMLHELQ